MTETRSPGAQRDAAAATLANAKGLAAIQAGDDTEAAEHFRAALDMNIGSAAAWNNLGIVHLKAGRYYDAAWAFESANRLAPAAIEPKVNLGLLFETVGWSQRAIDTYELALDQEPDNPQALSCMARARIQSGSRDGSVRELLDRLATVAENPETAEWAKEQLTKLDAPSP